ncbi:MAG: hypothetical protein LC792_24070 [Actinobacteria bacterium]|nr:hypothetical protein [Actinomycetota bacterium]
MDYELYRRYRASGGTDSAWRWESAVGVTNWNQASAPGQLGRKLERFVTRRPPADRWARATTNAMHWATGIGWGLQYGALAGLASQPVWLGALALGPTAWLAGYVVLPLAGVYEPIWKYDARTLEKDLAAHVVYGLVTAAAFAALTQVGEIR